MGKLKKDIIIKGARMHNLKNIDVQIPRNKLTVVTGVSGSGKSSLVFDTLYAEGQRRYVESLSAYARQFLGRMNKPEVDFIHGISPAIAIEQKVNTRNPRSTVATTTEIYDYLKLLFARAGVTCSPVSGKIVKRNTVEDVVNRVHEFDDGTKIFLLVELDTTAIDLKKKLEVFLQTGFTRLLVNEQPCEMEAFIAGMTENKKISTRINKANDSIFLLIDRFSVLKNDEDNTNRIADSVQTAFFEGNGECLIHIISEKDTFIKETFSNKFEMDGIKFEEPSVNFFSFNNPYGACKTCEGFGSVIGIDEDLVVPDKSLSVYEDCVVAWRGDKMSEWKNAFIKLSTKTKFPIHKSYSELSKTQKEFLWRGDKTWEGINGFFKDIERQTYKIQYRVMLARYRGKTICPDCHGTRLRKDAGYVYLIPSLPTASENKNERKANLQEILLMSIADAADYFRNIKFNHHDRQIAGRILTEIITRLSFLCNVGLGYLSLNRLSNSLSGGESQRINLATSLGSSLVGSLYILDEPSIGLHSRDTARLIKVLNELRDIGNTVVVVEHDEEIMKVADHIIDIGPYAGIHGGMLVAEGKLETIKESKISLTGKYLSGHEEVKIPLKRRKWNDFIEVNGARQHNLKNVSVKFPLHTLTLVTGVSGSGKTTLVKNILYPALQKNLGLYSGEKTGLHDSISGNFKSVNMLELVDQNPIGKSSRSNPITYIKAYDPIRELFSSLQLAKSRGYRPQHFSFNVDGGRCETCAGDGEVTIEMQFMADIHLTCEECKGSRFKEEILDIKYHDKNISDVLNMSVDEALVFFEDEKQIISKIQPLQEVGLGYIHLGQSSNTLSGGEAQRVKLASFLGKGKQSEHTLFIFDEPTTGLHFHDINKLLAAFNALIEQGNSIIVIEHNMEMIKCADWIIDLGPEAGDLGGELVFEGTPEEMVKLNDNHTATFLKMKLE